MEVGQGSSRSSRSTPEQEPSIWVSVPCSSDRGSDLWTVVVGRPATLYPMTNLTTRQQEVLDLWLDDVPYRTIAERLGISPETVNPHLKAIRKKLGAAGISRTALREACDHPMNHQHMTRS